MKKHLVFFAILSCLLVPVRATTVNLDAGELTGPLSAPIQIDNTYPSSNGSLLLLIDLGSSNAIDNTLTPGSFVSGTNTILAAGGFNTNSGLTNETNTPFSFNTGSAGDDIALRWFPQITLAQYKSGTLPVGGNYFGTYAPSPLGSAPSDGGNAWVIPSSGLTINLDFYTSNSDGGGGESPSAGYANSQVRSVPEPSTFALFGIGSFILFWFAQHRKAV